jgi:hypothetical protein
MCYKQYTAVIAVPKVFPPLPLARAVSHVGEATEAKAAPSPRPILEKSSQLDYTSHPASHLLNYFNRSMMPSTTRAVSDIGVATFASQRADDASIGIRPGVQSTIQPLVLFIFHFFIMISEIPRGKPERLSLLKSSEFVPSFVQVNNALSVLWPCLLVHPPLQPKQSLKIGARVKHATMTSRMGLNDWSRRRRRINFL